MRSFQRQILFVLFSLTLPLSSFSYSELHLSEEPTTKRSIFFSPLASFFIPGFGQVLNSEYKKAGAMWAYQAVGWSLEEYSKDRKEDFFKSGSLNYHHFRDLQKYKEAGSAMRFKVGFLSAYDAFATNVADYQAEGKYNFLPKDQNAYTAMLAPFQFSYLKRWTTYLPLIVGLAAFDSELNDGGRPENYDVRLVDVSSASIRSYNAGVGEEAVFRGWMMPMLYEGTGNFWLSNFIQGTFFGYAHGSTPYFQLAAGYYTGWLTERNGWDIGEAIFIHTWWDALVLTAEAVRSRSFTRDYNIPLSLSFTF